MNKKTKVLNGFSAALLAVSLLCGGIFAGAKVSKEMLEVNYNDVKIVVDGQEVVIKDGNGNSIEPFINNGTTYVPFRAVADAMGYEVKWVGETKTIYLSKPGEIPGEETNWMKKLPPYQVESQSKVYDGSNPKEAFSVAGVSHTVGIKLHNYLSNKPYALWNTNTLYKTMKFTIGSVDGNSTNTTLDIYLDGEYLSTYELKWDEPPQTITVPLNNAANVKIALNDHYITYGMYDISFSEN